MSQQQNNDMLQHFYRASAADFGKIPGSPVAYWVDEKVMDLFKANESLGKTTKPMIGMRTGNNDRFMRYWFEVPVSNVEFNAKNAEFGRKSGKKWFPYQKGGSFRRWYGNVEYIVNWYDDGYEIKSSTLEKYPQLSWDNLGWKISNEKHFFKPAITWTATSSSYFGVRFSPQGCLFDVKGSFCVPNESDLHIVLGVMGSVFASNILKVLNPTIEVQPSDISLIPLLMDRLKPVRSSIEQRVRELIEISKLDWDSSECSMDFASMHLIGKACNLINSVNIANVYQEFIERNKRLISAFATSEKILNSEITNAYGIADQYDVNTPLNMLTLNVNPIYRYGGNLSDIEKNQRYQSDTICELISYAIGCMMGRYSLDREGLVYAHAGNEGFKALVEEGAYATFAADEDGILPLSTDSWFEDDVATRLEAFVCTVWGKETLEENLQFIADSLCLSAIKPVKKGGETSRETLRRYLSTQFYKDHLKTYKKRPIYWLFSSGKEKAFECLVYLHRYNEATLPRMRTEYVTPLLGQMAGRIERLRLQQTEASTSDAKRIGKEIDSLTKQLSELRAFDDQLKHHADMRITLDLDDGVKINYGKFGTLLSDVKAITGDKGE